MTTFNTHFCIVFMMANIISFNSALKVNYEREGGENLIMNVLNYWSLTVFNKVVLKVTIF